MRVLILALLAVGACDTADDPPKTEQQMCVERSSDTQTCDMEYVWPVRVGVGTPEYKCVCKPKDT